MWLPLLHPLLGTWPATQACAVTGNRTGNHLVRRPAGSPLSHSSQGEISFICQLQWACNSVLVSGLHYGDYITYKIIPQEVWYPPEKYVSFSPLSFTNLFIVFLPFFFFWVILSQRLSIIFIIPYTRLWGVLNICTLLPKPFQLTFLIYIILGIWFSVYFLSLVCSSFLHFLTGKLGH